MKFIDKIGVELEGAFKRGKNFPYIKSESLDLGNWYYEEDDDKDKQYLSTLSKEDRKKYNRSKVIYRNNFHVGEINSEPYSNLRKLKSWINKYYPVVTDESCGYHIHISLKKTDHFYLLCTEQFNEFFLAKLDAWIKRRRWKGEFAKRAFNGNTYCQRGFHAGDKYRAVNMNHGDTIEFRIFSQCIPSKRAQECVDFVNKQVHAYLYEVLNVK